MKLTTKTENTEEWPDGERPITFDDEGKTTIWWWLLAFPAICFLCVSHFILCVGLTILVHPARNRKKIYEYYAPWGWGKRNGS
jgi:hypothetical protein